MITKKWYAVYTRSRSEKKTANLLEEKGINVYLPLIKTMRQWSDRKKMVEIPLISSYVFVCISNNEYDKVLKTNGVVRYVFFDGKAAEIRDNQIQAMKMAIEGNLNIEVDKDKFKKGEAVKVVDGPMKGVEGEYFGTTKKKNFMIRLSNIGYSLLLEIDAAIVKKL